MIRDSNPDCQSNPDPDPNVYRLAPKMLWIHWFVSISHFVKVCDSLINGKKCPKMPYSAVVKKMDK